MNRVPANQRLWRVPQPDGYTLILPWDQIPRELRASAQPFVDTDVPSQHPPASHTSDSPVGSPPPSGLENSPGSSSQQPAPAPQVVVVQQNWLTSSVTLGSGAFLLLAGVIFGFIPVTITGDGGGDRRVPCGSVFVSNYRDFSDPDDYHSLSAAGVEICDVRRDARVTVTWGSILLGAALAGAGALGRREEQSAG